MIYSIYSSTKSLYKSMRKHWWGNHKYPRSNGMSNRNDEISWVVYSHIKSFYRNICTLPSSENRSSFATNIYVMSYSPHNLIKRMKKEWWKLDRIHGSQHIFFHTIKHQTLPIPVHGNKDLWIGLYRSIEKILDNTLHQPT